MTEEAEQGSWTVLLSGFGATIAQVGGKAAALDRLAALDAPVLPAGSVTTSAYLAFVADPQLGAFLERLRTEPVPPPGEHEASRAEVEAAFLAAPIPAAMEDSIRRLGFEVGGGRPLAVRSSATAEDLQGASFAGQYRTVLGVDPADITTAVRLCWASLWSPVVRQYRRFRGIDERAVAMSVLVMPMLNPSHAGVLFTEDPANRDDVRIEIVEGLGEGLVSGAKTPEVLTVNRSDRIDFHPALAPLRELLETALRLEEAMGTALDLEWAIENGVLYILQARPITTRSGAESPADQFDVNRGDGRYTTAGIAEMLPGVLPPREWEINSWMVEEGLTRLFAILDADLSGLRDRHRLLSRFGGRVALNLDVMENVVASIPGGSVAELEHQYFGEVLAPPEATASPGGGGSSLLRSVRTLRARTQAFEESEVIIQAIDRVLDGEPSLAELSNEALLALRNRILYLGSRAAATEINVAATASSSYRSLEVFLRAHLDPEEALDALQRMTASDRDTLRGYRALGVSTLARELATSADLAPARACERWEDASEVLRSSPSGHDFLARLDAALKRAGSTSVFGGSTWEEVPALAWPSLRTMDRRPMPPSAARPEIYTTLEQRISGGFRQRVARLLQGQLVDVRTHFLRREAADAAAFLERREQSKAAMLMLGGVIWRLDRELGRRFTARGRLESAGDIDFLTGAEIQELACDAGPALDAIALRRRRHWAETQEPPLPQRFEGHPGAVTPRPTTGDSLQGWAVSPGRYEGPARVVAAADSRALRRGDVLVARTTDSSWLPLFHIAGAIVVEEGGPLSHAAILARELGMPAVVNVPGIVDRLTAQPGAFVMVDGTAGLVQVHPLEPGPGVIPARQVPEPARPDPGRLNVFITGLIGASALMSVAIGLTQAVGGIGTRARISRNARPRAEALGAAVLRGFDPTSVGQLGIVTRLQYLKLGALAAVIALAALWTTSSYVRQPSDATLFAFASAAISACGLAALAAVCFKAANDWPRVGPAARRLAAAPIAGFSPARYIGAGHAYVAGALLAAVLFLAFFVAIAESTLLRVDRTVVDWVDGGQDFRHWRPDLLNTVLHREYVIPAAIVLTLAAYRCRALMFTYPLVVTGGGFLHLGLAHLVERDRPEMGPKPGFTDAFPGGFLNEQTLMLGLLPLVAWALTGSARLRIALEALGALVIVMSVADAVRIADHWPSDNLAGLMIGLAMVTVARGVAQNPTLHGHCRGCPVQRELGFAG